MLNERTICELLSGLLPAGRLNQCFEADAELIQVNGAPCLFTTDEFSGEDLFRETDPYLLGWNVATGGISDILASGGAPLHYAHALTVGREWTIEYVKAFGCGVRDVLEATGARFIGGDCGRAQAWRCTVSVLGSCPGRAVTRLGTCPGDALYVSGPIGAGNLEAALSLRRSAATPVHTFRNQFVPRLRESGIMRKHASACIDTSDGLWAALNTLAELNRCGYAVADLPYIESGARFCKLAAIPKTLLFLGGCGEYELLFSVRPDREPLLAAEARQAGCTFFRLGSVQPAGRALREDGRTIDLAGADIQARDYSTLEDYLRELSHWLDQRLLPSPSRSESEATHG